MPVLVDFPATVRPPLVQESPQMSEPARDSIRPVDPRIATPTAGLAAPSRDFSGREFDPPAAPLAFGLEFTNRTEPLPEPNLPIPKSTAIPTAPAPAPARDGQGHDLGGNGSGPKHSPERGTRQVAKDARMETPELRAEIGADFSPGSSDKIPDRIPNASLGPTPVTIGNSVGNHLPSFANKLPDAPREDVSRPAPAPHPMNSGRITVRVETPEGDPVDLSVTSRGERVHVEVRTADAGM